MAKTGAPRGRKARAGAAAKHKVTIRLTDQELLEWKKIAGGRAIGELVREAVVHFKMASKMIDSLADAMSEGPRGPDEN